MRSASSLSKTITKLNLQKNKECWFCHTTNNLHHHEIFFGTANRKKSIETGMQVWLCGTHHNMSGHSVHHNHDMDLKLKQWGQREFEKVYGHETFMNTFHKNYMKGDDNGI